MKILISSRSFGKTDKAPINMIKNAGFEVVINPYGRKMTEDELKASITDVVGVVAGTEIISNAVISKGHELKVISRAGIGMENVDLKAAKEKGILVYNTPDAPTLAVAELTVGLMLNLLRKISECDREIRRDSWKQLMGTLLTGKTLGIIGLGRIGKTLTRLLKLFNLKIIAHDPFPDHAFAQANKVKFTKKENVLKESDIITLHVPLTQENFHMIGAKELSLMKKNASIINTSRGGLIDEDALFKALDAGKIGGAAIDAFEKEPYTGPLTNLSNVILTPHIGSCARESRIKMEIETVENLIKGLKEKGVL